MIWPTEITLYSRTWKILYYPKEHAELQDEDDYLLGWCDPTTSRICVCMDQDDASKADTLIHEMFHACFSTAPMAGAVEDPEDEEENIVLFATAAFLEIVRNSQTDWWRVGSVG